MKHAFIAATAAAALLISCVNNAQAGAYFDIGLGYAVDSNVSIGRSCLRDFKEDIHQWGCVDNPLGLLGIGYEFQNGLAVSAEHWGGLQDKDYGLNLLTVKYRFHFGE